MNHSKVIDLEFLTRRAQQLETEAAVLVGMPHELGDLFRSTSLRRRAISLRAVAGQMRLGSGDANRLEALADGLEPE